MDNASLVWFRDRRIVGITPFRPTLVVIPHLIGAHQFQGKRHHRRAPSRLAIGNGRSVERDALLSEQFSQLLGTLEALAFLIEKLQPLQVNRAWNRTAALGRLYLAAVLR